MIKQEIVSYIRSFLPREDATQRFHELTLTATIERVIIEMYQDIYKINPRLLSKYTKQYGETTPIAVKLNQSAGIYYSDLPSKIVGLPCSYSGVVHVYTVNHAGNVFQPMDATEADLIFNTDVAIVTNKIGYRTRQDTRIDYWNMNTTVYNEGVRMDLLIPFSAYEDNDVVMIPELGEKEGGAFTTRVLSLLGIVPPADLTDDNGARVQAAPTNKQ
jgi:hypothetical protein